MTSASVNQKTQPAELFTNAFLTFCGDISGMFGMPMTPSMSEPARATGSQAKAQFGELSAFIRFHAEGALNGDFQIAVDREGLFTLAGVIAMRPEQEILGYCKNGSAAEADELCDAVAEAGNLFAASFSRLPEAQSNVSFTHTFIGNPQDESYKHLSDSEQLVIFSCQMTVAAYPAFQCGIILTDRLYQELCDMFDDGGDEHREPADGAVSQAIQSMVDVLPNIMPENLQELFGLQACEIMEKDLVWVNPDDSIQQAMEQIRQAASGCLLVGEPSSVQGIVTRSDIAEAASIYLRPVFSQWRRSTDEATLKIRLKIIMSSPVCTIGKQARFADIVNTLYQKRLHYLPVTNEEGHIEGLVSINGALKVLLNSFSGLPEQAAMND